MNKFTSPYYPRRARWYGRFFYFGLTIRHRLALDRMRLPREMTFGGLAGSFFIPGLAVYLRGSKLHGKLAMAACALLFHIFIIWLGYPAANVAFGLIISIHTSGFAYYCSPYLWDKELPSRILFTIGTMILLGLVIYAPMRGMIQNHWLTPLRRNGHVVIIEKFASAGAVTRGDWIMYSLKGFYAGEAHGEGGAVRLQQGFGWGPVLGIAGDRVLFLTNSFTVNGVSHPLLPHMPQKGGLTVAEKQWFIWPELNISGHGNVGEDTLSGTMLQLAAVSEGQLVGKPFKRWFWRKQILP